MATFSVGSIVRPIRGPYLTYNMIRRDGDTQDFRGIRSAQGIVMSIGAVGAISGAAFWDPTTSTTPSPTSGAVQQYGVKCWDEDARAYTTLTYPEDALAAGVVGSTPITALFIDPEDPAAIVNVVQADGSTAKNNPSANVVRSRI